MQFKEASHAEILRAAQKDDYILSKLRLDVSEVAQRWLGPGTWLKWKQELDLASDVLYFLLTTLSDFQTLGEEYVNIVQVDNTKRRIPSKELRTLTVVLHVGMPYLINRVLMWMERTLQALPTHSSLRPEAATAIVDVLPKLRHFIIFLHRCHLTSFYMDGMFYHLAKRLVRIRYVLVRNWLGNNNSQPYFQALGYLSAFQMVLWVVLALQSHFKHTVSNDGKSITKRDIEDSYVTPSLRCSLCLELRRHPTATPCGHLFCWNCIVEWVANKPECPLCREEVNPSRLVCLQNYT